MCLCFSYFKRDAFVKNFIFYFWLMVTIACVGRVFLSFCLACVLGIPKLAAQKRNRSHLVRGKKIEILLT